MSDVCIRGSWFTLRAGAANLHVQALQAAKMPWHQGQTVRTISATERKEDTIHTKVTTMPTSVAATDTAVLSESTPYWYPGDLSLILAGSELHPEWTGWMEGAVRSGTLAAKRLHPYLFPPMVPRNFAKRVPVVVPGSVEVHPEKKLSMSLPMRSPSLDRKRSSRRNL